MTKCSAGHGRIAHPRKFTHSGGCEACATLPIPPEVQDILVSETLKCNPSQLAKLMADHTQLDWRPILPLISVPCLNLIGCKSGIFPPEGCAEVGRLIQSASFADHIHTVLTFHECLDLDLLTQIVIPCRLHISLLRRSKSLAVCRGARDL